MSSLKWVKVYTSLLHNARFKKLSERARWTFVACLLVAGDLGGDKELLIQGWGPVTALDISGHTDIPERKQKLALDELVHREFLSISPRGAYVIEKWDEMAGEESRLKSNRDRQQRHRERNALRNGDGNGDDNALRNGDNVTDKEEEKEKEIETEVVSNDTTAASRPTRSKNQERTPAEIEAYRILDAAWSAMDAHHDMGITRTDWRKHNKRAATELVAAGKTAEKVQSALKVAFEHPEGRKLSGNIATLAKLQEHWPRLAAIASGRRSTGPQYKIDDGRELA